MSGDKPFFFSRNFPWLFCIEWFVVSSMHNLSWSFWLRETYSSAKETILSVIFTNILEFNKLDGVAPLMTDPPPISSTTLSEKKKKKKCDTWHVTCDTWHVTGDTGHGTRDTFGGVNILSKFQLLSSYRLWFMILWRYFRKRITDLIN